MAIVQVPVFVAQCELCKREAAPGKTSEEALERARLAGFTQRGPLMLCRSCSQCFIAQAKSVTDPDDC